MLYIVYIIKIGPALRKKKVKSREIQGNSRFFKFYLGKSSVIFGKLQNSREIQGYLGKSREVGTLY